MRDRRDPPLARPAGERAAGPSSQRGAGVLVAQRVEVEVDARERGAGDEHGELARVLDVAEAQRDVDAVEVIAVEAEHDVVDLAAAGGDATVTGGANVGGGELRTFDLHAAVEELDAGEAPIRGATGRLRDPDGRRQREREPCIPAGVEDDGPGAGGGDDGRGRRWRR